MLKAGIIGNLKLFEPVIKHIRERENVQITGKSTIGIAEQANSLHFTIPEFSRTELIERSDVLLINNFSLVSYATLTSIIRKSKHIFAAEYPRLSRDEWMSLSKLVAEANTVFQVINPFYQLPGFYWIRENIRQPFYLDVTRFNRDFNPESDIIKLLLMLKGIGGFEPKKIGAVTFTSQPGDGLFFNARLEFGNASVVNLNYGRPASAEEFIIKGYANDLFFRYDIDSAQLTSNRAPIDLSPYETLNEFDVFMQSVNVKNKSFTDISDYTAVLQLVENIGKKLDQFTGQ